MTDWQLCFNYNLERESIKWRRNTVIMIWNSSARYSSYSGIIRNERTVIFITFSVCVYCNRSQKTSQRVKNNIYATRTFCSLHDVTSSVIYYSTHARKNVIYLLKCIQANIYHNYMPFRSVYATSRYQHFTLVGSKDRKSLTLSHMYFDTSEWSEPV